MLLFGLLQYPVQAGMLSFHPDGTFGLVLLLLSIQMITVGKTPFGTFRRTWLIIILGVGTAVPGTGACFIPGLLTGIIRFFVAFLMITGGTALFLQLVWSGERARQWIRIPGILRHLTIACALVYLLEVWFGCAVLVPSLLPGIPISILALLFGISLFYLAFCLQRVSDTYPRGAGCQDEEESSYLSNAFRFLLLQEASLSVPVSFLILLGVIFTLFALLLIPIGLGLYPFSRDSQFGLLMVIMAIQVLALGKTPLGIYKRSWPLILIGLLIVSLGICSCMIPGLLTGWMLTSLGLWNLITGSLGLFKIIRPYLQKNAAIPNDRAPRSPVKKKTAGLLMMLHLMTLMFGLNLIVPFLIPTIIPIILFILGLLFFRLATILNTVPAREQENRIV
ncbi:MAG TPA: hypothetical protein PK024_10655 [Methanospirillum sp.]|uniref:hypothetical protein n=1 Tax=Methanospirillum sp. TaxID=45200 RepID=UPI002C058E77|nr:hypothetical protein [Methanospirillum sp.]HOJ97281.1 hypothetical protein [Methanospirillum sp.]HPP78562.1 hypothetical protein [Methanospirillum sp.]